ncbi:peptidoglycan recognition protein family protein [Streptococcus caviae]|uniref:peptidoglycan recognition protein family protein n=1 Tax=Streptococcus sp. 'caviae' TaxID=1915004 RepID=UPI00094B99A5|nr:peptidoglycan recognition family protein [Streptococcus sp. 'caviae']OLN83671.1 N-acetylmuramoyl-L-alanine amidase [Streptococcus sp. 'caviae']
MAKKRKTKKQSPARGRRSRQRKKKKQMKYPVLAGLLLALLALTFFIYQHRFHVSASYKVNQKAIITADSSPMLYPYLFDLAADSLEQNATVQVEGYFLTKLKGKQVTLAKITLRGRSYYLDAKNLQIQQTNTINQYIASLNYPHAEITQAIYQQFKQQAYFGASAQPKGIIIHDTGNDSSSLQSEVSYMKQNYKSAGVFVHSFIDKDSIFQIADDRYMAQGAGPKGNPYYLQFELIREHSQENFARQLANAAYYTAVMLKKYQLPVTLGQKDASGTVWTHQMVSSYLGGTDHQDPDDYWNGAAAEFFASDYSVQDFLDLIQVYYNQL